MSDTQYYLLNYQLVNKISEFYFKHWLFLILWFQHKNQIKGYRVLLWIRHVPTPYIYTMHLYIYFACRFVCFSVRLHPINVKADKPVGPIFFVGPGVTQVSMFQDTTQSLLLIQPFSSLLQYQSRHNSVFV